MAIEHHYQNPTTAAIEFDEVVDAIILADEALVEDGQQAAVGSSGVAIQDPEGSHSFRSLQRWYILETDGPSELELTGTVAKSTASTTITGTGTAFDDDLSPGDEVVIPGGGGTDYVFVKEVTDATHFELWEEPGHSASGQTATRAAQQRLWTGWTGDEETGRDIGRGGIEPIESGRVFGYDLREANTALHFRITRGSDWGLKAAVGSATTVGDRLAAMLATDEASLIFDDGLVAYPTTALDKADQKGRFLDEILNDLMQVAGYNASLDYHEATGHLQLIFADPTSFMLPSPVQVSDDPADSGEFLYRPAGSAKRVRQSAGIFAGVQVQGARQVVYRTNAATADTYEWVDANAISTNRKKLAKVQAFGDRFLVDASHPDDRVTVPIVIEASRVHLVRRLRQIQVKFTELPGWSTWQWARILRRDLGHAVAENGEPIPDRYRVGLVLVPAGDGPPAPTETYGELQGANQPAIAGLTDVLVNWCGTGDNHFPGWGSHPKVGFVDYDDTGNYGGSCAGASITRQTGIKITGDGTISSIGCDVVGWQVVWGGGSVTVELRQNGVAIASETAFDSGTGLHFWSGSKSVHATDVAVSNGDIFTFHVVLTDAPATGNITGNVGKPFSLTGALS